MRAEINSFSLEKYILTTVCLQFVFVIHVCTFVIEGKEFIIFDSNKYKNIKKVKIK